MKTASKLFLFFLKLNKKTEIPGHDLAQALNYLAQYEIKEGGPYYDEQHDIDLGLNVLIAIFLKKQKVTLPNLDKLIKKAIKENQIKSKYFSNASDLKKLCSNLYLKEKKLPPETENKFLNNIIKEAFKRFEKLNPEFKKLAKDAIDRTIKNNRDGQMSLMPYYFKKALGKKGRHLSDSLIAELGLANTFFWTAFIIYDDFWDEDEKAAPKLLPVANFLARSYISYFNKVLPNNQQFTNFFTDLMDRLDSANTWETLHCRTRIKNNLFYIPKHLPNYQDYTKKFEPASGHILGCIALMVKLGYKIKDQEINNLISYFKNYLIAMQINDDAHDLQEDLSRGHLSTVAVMFLHDWQKKYPDQKVIDLKNDLEKIQQLFWFTTVKKSCRLTISYTSKARKSLAAMNFLENPQYLEKFINISENVAKTASFEQKKSLDLLQAL
jgi:hypothetical protein